MNRMTESLWERNKKPNLRSPGVRTGPRKSKRQKKKEKEKSIKREESGLGIQVK